MIRLITVIGHGVELLPHFINHYTKYVDEIQIVCYKSDINPSLDIDILNIIQKYNNVKIIKTIYDRIFDWEKVTSLYNECKLLYPNDWWIVADIDEFHLYPDNLHNILNECNINGWELIRGGFVDRIGENGTFPSINDYESIWKQFPNMGFFRYPMSGACPNKVCIMKGWVNLTSGQHYALIDGHNTWRWQGWNHPLIAPINKYSIQVHHFKWDITSIQRIKKIADLNQNYSYSEEYLKMYNSLKKHNFLIDLNNKEYMIESSNGKNKQYKNWNVLIKKIVSI